MKAVILDFETLEPNSLDLSGLNSLTTEFGVQWDIHNNISAENLLHVTREADIVFTNKVELSESALQQMNKLSYIGVLATGTNNIDRQACDKLGIRVENVEAYGTSSVIQHAFMLLLNLVTQGHRYQQAVKAGDWIHSKHFCMLDFPITELKGKTMGILGYGELGKNMSIIAEAFGMKVIVLQRPTQKANQSKVGDPVERVPFFEGLKQVDVLSLHCLLSDETTQLIDRDVLSAMKESAYLINTARGGLVNELDLIAALQAGEIAGAGLDVLSTEPPSSDNPLLKHSLPNLIITPHSAWGAVEARQRLWDQAIAKLTDWIKNHRSS